MQHDTWKLGLWALAAILATGCAGDQGEIDRIQPGYVKKSDLLDGAWYYRRTVVDNTENIGAGNDLYERAGFLPPWATIGNGDWLTIERIRWDVQESYLVAYRDYEYTHGAEGPTVGDERFSGSPVAAFRITSHFDIVYEYNTATGERTNVRSENVLDNVWYEREYMRVDWSRNEGTAEVDYMLPFKAYDTALQGTGNFYVYEDEAANPWRARVEPHNGYIDFVAKHWTMPDDYYCYGTLELSYTDCGPGEVALRHAFMRVDEEQENGYDPLLYPDTVVVKDENGDEIRDPQTNEVLREPVFQRFGYYRLERPTYDRYQGLTDKGVNRNIIRFNLWQRSRDENGNVIPYAQREVRPIVYYLNWDFPADLKQVAGEVAAEWNDVFRTTVASLQGRDKGDVPDMFVLRENSCNTATLGAYLAAHRDVDAQVRGELSGDMTQGDLDHWCAATEYFSRTLNDRFVWQQRGDPRFNMMDLVQEVSYTPWLGLGPMFGDPVSGRNVVATAYVMGWLLDVSTTRALEYIDYINGELDFEDIYFGMNLPYDPSLTTPPEGRAVAVTDLDVAARAARVPSQAFMSSAKQRVDRYRPSGAQGSGAYTSAMTPLENSGYYAERLARLAGTSLEAEALQPVDYVLASRGAWQPGTGLSNELKADASLAMRYVGRREQAQRHAIDLHRRTVFPAANLDGALQGFAKELKDLGVSEGLDYEARRKLRWKRLREEIFRAVMLHEVGHNVGLRHNFEASYDAVNWHDDFWAIEQGGGTVQAKLDARQPEYTYSSIMDYHGRVNADFHGLGKYDYAAIKFGYGQIVEVFADDTVAGGQSLRQFRFENDYKDLLVGSDQYFVDLSQMGQRADTLFDWNQPITPAALQAMHEREVPYLFCSDEFANATPTCRTGDLGGNMREVMASYEARYKNYFVFDRFLRNRLTLDVNRAVAPASAAFATASLIYKYWYLYQSLDPNFLDKDVGQDMLQASADGLNLMAETLSKPDIGEYIRCGDGPTEAYMPNFALFDMERGVNGEVCDPSSKVFLTLGDGLPFLFWFSEDDVAWTYTYFGTYFDKDEALFYLSYAPATYFRVNDVEDFRTFSVSPYRTFDAEIRSLLTPWVRYDQPGAGAYVDDTALDASNRPLGGIVNRQLVDTNGGLSGDPVPQPLGTVRVLPAISRYLQRRGSILGMALLTSRLDQSLDYSKYARIVQKGSLDDFDDSLAPPGDIVECTLPTAGITYRALRVSGEDTVATRILQDCNDAIAGIASAPEDAESYYDRKAFYRDRLAEIQQHIQYMRLLELVYEHGSDL